MRRTDGAAEVMAIEWGASRDADVMAIAGSAAKGAGGCWASAPASFSSALEHLALSDTPR